MSNSSTASHKALSGFSYSVYDLLTSTRLLPNPDFFAGPRMLDVHVPHKTEHTWTDFIIHIATITVGLFIAIGLEQTVEHFHHLHQLHQLEDNLRDELRVDLRRDA